jgi:hypothetical protein
MSDSVARLDEALLRPALGEAGALLFAALRDRPDAATRARLAALGPVDWRRVAELALRTQVGSLLHHRLRATGQAACLPAEVAERLARAYAWNVARNTALLAERDRTCALLDAAGIPVMVVKGAHLAPLLYGTVGARPMSDVDVLVPFAELQRAQDVLLRAGYGPPDRPPVRDSFHEHRHLPLFRRPGGLPVELHWTLSDREDDAVRPEDLGIWQRAVPLPGGHGVGMEPLDALLYTCRHLAVHHGFGTTNGLSGLADVAALVERYPLVGDELVSRCRRWGLVNGVWLSLALAEALLGAPLPAGVLAELRPTGIRAGLALTAVRTLLQPSPLRDLLLRGPATLVPPPAASNVLGPAPVRSLAAYVAEAAFPPRDDLRLEFPKMRRPPVSWLAWPRHWSRLAWTHAGLLRWPAARGELRAENARRRELQAFVAPTPSI